MGLFSDLKQSLADLFSLNETHQPWHLPLLAAVCVGIPGAIGVSLNNFADAMYACFAALVVLYLPATDLAHRMTTLAVCAFGFTVSFTLGALAAVNSGLFIVVLTLVSWLVIVICRYFRVPPPGSFFFIMLLIIAGAHPFELASIPHKTGLVALGAMLTCFCAFLYSLGPGRNIAAKPVPPEQRVNALILEGLAISVCIGGSLAVAVLLGLENPYWVPISCAAILQGATFRMVWRRNVHRIVGTLVGMVLTWSLLHLHMSPWAMLACIVILQCLIEFFVPRNYGLAVIFITPLTVFFAEVNIANKAHVDWLIFSRVIDIVLGSMIGFAGGWVIHQTRLFEYGERLLDKLLPPRVG